MRVHHHSSNENTFRDKVIGSKFFDGRYWLYLGRKQFNAEWSFFHRCRSHFALKVEFGHGDGDDGIMFHAAIPYLFSVFFSFDGIFGRLFHGKVESRETGIAFHNGSFWLYPFAKTMSWSRSDPWWSKSHSFDPTRKKMTVAGKTLRLRCPKENTRARFGSILERGGIVSAPRGFQGQRLTWKKAFLSPAKVKANGIVVKTAHGVSHVLPKMKSKRLHQ